MSAFGCWWKVGSFRACASTHSSSWGSRVQGPPFAAGRSGEIRLPVLRGSARAIPTFRMVQSARTSLPTARGDLASRSSSCSISTPSGRSSISIFKRSDAGLDPRPYTGHTNAWWNSVLTSTADAAINAGSTRNAADLMTWRATASGTRSISSSGQEAFCAPPRKQWSTSPLPDRGLSALAAWFDLPLRRSNGPIFPLAVGMTGFGRIRKVRLRRR